MTGSRLPNRPYFDRTRRKRGHLVQKLPHSAETPPPAGCMRADTPPVSRPHVHRHLVQKPRTTAETPCRPATYAQRPSSLNRRPIAHVQGDRPDACGHPPPESSRCAARPSPHAPELSTFRSAGVRSVPKPFAPPKSFLAISPAKPVKLQQITTVRKNFP